jgi:hypothetical protein
VAAHGSWCAFRGNDHDTGPARGDLRRGVCVVGRLWRAHAGLTDTAHADSHATGTHTDDHTAAGLTVRGAPVYRRTRTVRLSSGPAAAIIGRMDVTMKRGDTTR